MGKRSPFTDLLKNEKPSKNTYLFHIQHSKISETSVFLKFEVFNHKKESVFNFKIQIDPDDNIKKLKVGDTIDKVGMVSLQSKNIFQMLKEGVESAIGEGRIPFLPGS